MSKYIDAERLNMEWETLKPFGVTDTMIENLKWIVDRQPTIEVSEDCIYTYCSRCGMRVVVNAPSVTAEQSSKVHCKDCRWSDCPKCKELWKAFIESREVE